MDLKKCPYVSYSMGDKFTPRCLNFNYDTDYCSGQFPRKCVPYDKIEMKKLEIYWKCMEQKENNKNGINR